jgi:hypothetical protein
MNPSQSHPQSAQSAGPKYRIPVLARNAAPESWVTLVTCGNLIETDMLRAQLESAGIETFVPDENLMTVEGWALNTYGYIRLQVRPGEYDAARELLCASGQAVAG